MREELREKQREIQRRLARERLIKKYGETFLKLPQFIEEGLTLKEIGKILGVTKQQVSQYLKNYFPEYSPHSPPKHLKNLYSTSQLLKLYKHKSPESLKELLRRHHIKPKQFFGGKNYWGEDAYQFVQSLLNRHCQVCQKPFSPLTRPNRKYCSEKCRIRDRKK